MRRYVKGQYIFEERKNQVIVRVGNRSLGTFRNISEATTAMQNYDNKLRLVLRYNY